MKLMRKLVGKGLALASLGLLAGLIFAGCATSEEPQFTSTPFIDSSGAGPVVSPNGSTNTTGPSEPVYRLHIGDQVIITFSGTPELIPQHEERVKEDGNITLALIGAVKAEGKTTAELQQEIHNRYVPKYYVRLTVTVKILPVDLYYYVSGEVRSPGPKSWISDTTVTKAISAAGGFTEYARKSRIQLIRSGGKTPIILDWSKIAQDPSADPKVFPGDSILVRRSAF